MKSRDYRDLFGGGALILIGTFAAAYAASRLDLGTVRRMGPGMFPTALGVVLASFGVALVVPAFLRPGEMPRVDVRPLVAVLAAIAAFAVMIRPFGIVPTIAATTFIVTRAEVRLPLVHTAILAAVLTLLALLVFKIGLGLPVPMIRWPW